MLLVHLLFLLCTTIRPKNKVLIDSLFATIRPKYMVLFHIFFRLCTTIGPHWFISLICTLSFDQNIWSFFIYSSFYERPLEQKLRSLLIFFYMHTTIQPKYMVLFDLFFLFWTTIRPIIKVLIDLFRSFAQEYSTKIYGPLSFILSFVRNHSTKN